MPPLNSRARPSTSLSFEATVGLSASLVFNIARAPFLMSYPETWERPPLCHHLGSAQDLSQTPPLFRLQGRMGIRETRELRVGDLYEELRPYMFAIAYRM